ncbi:aconitate hydratase AcnA [Methylotuvimicrobium alcaliphilum]|uniref:Aconitate hydratase n=1 Tax=Methylotuvimicrobium alcaliphilum (strain DSM 19304 / NCIMB 14124 / VKM B-2133 / 20Z) TaxID=1091494 RepID=G4SWU4_META2|nr:aconitate hydratase AcnA [Methylotuvimicrobium alcaliphilum]CCE22010.1 Aconitate hydratase (Citrate hydro-lyase) (Aconitase) [Methylotuvimicrobium alcaliphilum 20Z]
MNSKDPFGARQLLNPDRASPLSYYRLACLESAGAADLARLPHTIKILLESLLRNCDGYSITEDHVLGLAAWQAQGSRREIPYKPARVILQDFTGVPALVDLAAMRDAMNELGGDPKKINPFIPCDLVIDHSVQVDYFGKANALPMNEAVEFQRNQERYEFLKWGQSAFQNLRVVPPSTGIVHQVNLEYLAQVVFHNKNSDLCYPDSCVGTDSHTPMVNGLGVLAWGVGGIEAEAVILDQPIYMLEPDVVGIKLTGKLPPGVTATDLVLRITELCRQFGVVGQFVEFYGSGLSQLSIPDRATISNMAPEQGSTVSFFPVDKAALNYMRLTGRSPEQIELTERYAKLQGLFRTDDAPEPEFTRTLEVDLGEIEPALAGPKRPQDRIPLSQVGPTYRQTLIAPVGIRGMGLAESDLDRCGVVSNKGACETITHGAVVIAAITSCTNTSNPSVMLGAGLVAKKAVEKGLKVKNYVKTSLAPGSQVVTEYLKQSGLLPYLEALGFYLVGYGCTTCIGNSGPLDVAVEEAIVDNDLVVSAVLSGNRNFEGRVHPLTKTNYLASPPLVVAYALAGSTVVDMTREAIGQGSDGDPVFLRDIWPTTEEIDDVVQKFVTPEMFRERYADVFTGTQAWQAIAVAGSERYQWNEQSTYIRKPPFFEGLGGGPETIGRLADMRVLALFGDSVTTDHISPAGQIAPDSPAALYLLEKGVERKDWNSYGSRRGNDQVMCRGTFANVRIHNLLVPGAEGNVTIHHPSGERMTFFDAAMKYKESGMPLCILAGKEYGSGSSRDWAAKGPFMQGVKAVIAESYERIHRSNLIGMGILPLQFMSGESAQSLGLKGDETVTVDIADDTVPQQVVDVTASAPDGSVTAFKAVSRIDTPIEIQYYRDGGILRTVLKKLRAG